MDIKDLMVSDFVYVVRGYDKHLTIEKINGIIADKDKSYPVTLSTGETVSLNDIKPIPLTSDILVKNGFDIEPCGCVWYQEHGISEQNYIVVSFYKNGEVRKVELSFVNKVHGEFRDIYTLHQLQHLLRLCGIEKEIEL